jgi:hypothetical protein
MKRTRQPGIVNEKVSCAIPWANGSARCGHANRPARGDATPSAGPEQGKLFNADLGTLHNFREMAGISAGRAADRPSRSLAPGTVAAVPPAIANASGAPEGLRQSGRLFGAARQHAVASLPRTGGKPGGRANGTRSPSGWLSERGVAATRPEEWWWREAIARTPNVGIKFSGALSKFRCQMARLVGSRPARSYLNAILGEGLKRVASGPLPGRARVSSV